ncbi:MAG TPA: DUF362 domain-containing protein [Deltaproteobacteria bacterium]|nr:DUF362 domain-containing protein [Deltaproteobacteria bacterium]
MATILKKTDETQEGRIKGLSALVRELDVPFEKGDSVGIKLHWGERGNRSFLDPVYAKTIVAWLNDHGVKPFIFDTTVLYSGGRRLGTDALATAERHGFTEEYLECPIVIADGLDGRDVIDLPAGYPHFKTVQVASVLDSTQGFVIFSHFKGHLASGFGGAVKNISMGFASRAQKQRMHADVHPVLNRKKCTRCGICAEICPTGAARIVGEEYPTYDLDLCIGCAQCIAQCPELALKILWGSDVQVFQEKLVETAAAIWHRIEAKTVLINALIKISAECDCLPGKMEIIAPDVGFLGGYHPLSIDAESVNLVGRTTIDSAHPYIDWQRQFDYAREIGFSDTIR